MNEIAVAVTNTPATLQERFAALRQKAASASELWQPEPGESLLGELVGSQLAVGTYGENHQILVRDESGNIIAAWLTAWLRDNLRIQNAEQGDFVAITFLGKRTSPAGRNYNAYSLIVDKA
jgi:hypothetical protein